MASVSASRHRQRQPRPGRPARPGRRAGLAIGADVGGTWIRVAAMGDGGRTTTIALRSPRELDRVAARLAALWRRRGWTRRRVAALAVASRGVWTPGELSALARRVRRLARRVRALSDAQAALLGALGGGPGLLLLAGTGSIVVGLDARGRWARAGGLGPLLGDEGSAFWLGREWLRAASRHGRWQAALAAVRAPEPVGRIAALAPRVVARARRGDAVALAIARRAQAGLAAGARDVARQLRLRPPVAVSWAGGVLADPWFRAGVARALARAGVRARWRRPAAAPVAAALRLAVRMRERARGDAR
ncbi:MAG: hypothetical protein HYU26_16115 [Candidatus Rokubacteria bacterium]|nr:hypothetical protein [Candidatus Rokubacteria bacterium]